jgi:bifunctional DNA-binding transcriptional regulator/antitoxin component of YhaV-PrlF toxin-antitoxin module
MLITITTKRQATFPAKVLEALGAKQGDRLELIETPNGFLLRTRRIDPTRLAPLRGKLRRGQGSFDLETFREEPHDPTLRD